MPYFLLKEEPAHYSYERLEAEGRTEWSGVRHPVAQRHLRSMVVGDQAFLYHTGHVRAIVGIVEVTGPPHPAPGAPGRCWSVPVRPVRRLPRAVALAELRSEARFADSELMRHPRLSVLPVPAALWRHVLERAGVPAPVRAPPAR